MADWKKLAKAALLSDGKIDTKEVEIIKKELLADGKIDASEAEFLISLRKHATGTVKAFDDLFFSALKKFVLADGSISAKEAGWLRSSIFADGKVDDGEKAFLKDLKASAKSVDAAFTKLLSDAGVA